MKCAKPLEQQPDGLFGRTHNILTTMGLREPYFSLDLPSRRRQASVQDKEIIVTSAAAVQEATSVTPFVKSD